MAAVVVPVGLGHAERLGLVGQEAAANPQAAGLGDVGEGLVDQQQRGAGRYYSFYSWILHRFIFDSTSSRRLADFRGPYFRRHEVAYILGCFSHHMNGSFLRGLVGGGNVNFRARQMWQSSDPVSLDANYFINTLGGFGQYYRTAMQAMGIVAEPEASRWVYRLTDRGQRLAQAYEASIAHTAYFKTLQARGQLAEISQADAEEYGRACCLCADALTVGSDLDPLRDAFFRFDQTGAANPHVRRRLNLGLVLDLVHQSAGKCVAITGRYIRLPGLFHQTSPAGHIFGSRGPACALSQLPAHRVFLGAAPEFRD